MGFLFSLNCVPLWFVARILYVYMSSVAPPPPAGGPNCGTDECVKSFYCRR